MVYARGENTVNFQGLHRSRTALGRGGGTTESELRGVVEGWEKVGEKSEPLILWEYLRDRE